MSPLCDFAHRFPSVVATILDQESRLTKGRFREETFTDLMAASLAMLAGPGLEIAYPHEKWTGGDLDLCYLHQRSGERLTVRIQAKRLSPATDSKRSNAWKFRRYDHIDHVVRGTGEYQYRTLSRKKRSIVSLYAFYNHHSVLENPSVKRLIPSVDGINLAFAATLGKKLDVHVTPGLTHRFRTDAKRLTEFQPDFFAFFASCFAYPEVPSRPRATSRTTSEGYRQMRQVPTGRNLRLGWRCRRTTIKCSCCLTMQRAGHSFASPNSYSDRQSFSSLA